MGFINKDKILKLSKKGKYVLMAGMVGSILIFPGCTYERESQITEEQQKQLNTDLLEIIFSGVHTRELSTDAKYDDTNDVIDPLDKTSLEEGITQVLDVNGEEFKLVVDVRCLLKENRFWTVTDNKMINIELRTDGLVGKKKVYVDNVHINTYIKSCFSHMDGIKQDEDNISIHTNELLGFPINDGKTFIGIGNIYGNNDSFITDSINGMSYLSSEPISKKRIKENDFLLEGVYANRIVTIVDLLIDDGKEIKAISVPTEFDVLICPYVSKVNADGTLTYNRYYYDSIRGKVVSEEVNDMYEGEIHKVYAKTQEGAS